MNSRTSYVQGACDQPLIGATIGQMFDAMALEHAGREALVVPHQNLRWSYQELRRRVDDLASGLMRLGLEPGDRLGIWSPNCAEWVLTQFASAKAGLVLVNINPSYLGRELEYALNKVECKALIAAPGFKRTDYIAILQGLSPQMEHRATNEWRSASLPSLRSVIRLGSDRTPGMLNFDELARPADAADLERLAERAARLQFDDPINIQFTSGTTGTPKGATLTHHNILNNAFFVGEAAEADAARPRVHPGAALPLLRHGDRQPGLHHARCDDGLPGRELRCAGGAAHGAGRALHGPLRRADDVHRRARPSTICGIRPHQPPHRHHGRLAVPNRGHAPCRREDAHAAGDDRLRHDRDLADQFPELGRRHAGAPGLDRGPGAAAPGGRRSSTPSVASCREDTTGELLTRGYSVMLGYWADEARTREAIDAARWMRTGDLATIDDQGYCNIVGRVKDMVIRGGENIYPREIEEFLYQHAKVKDVQCIGVPDAKYGEELCACIILREGEQATEQDIRDFCTGRIARYKIPRYVRFMTSFPMTVTGKVAKYLLREQISRELGVNEIEAA